MLAALLLELERALVSPWRPRTWWAWLKLSARRVRLAIRPDNVPSLAWALLLLAVGVVSAVLVSKKLTSKYEAILAGLPVVGALFLARSELSKLQPPAAQLLRAFERTDYSKELQFLGNFQNDLKLLLAEHCAKRKLILFIDDLDRCETPIASELLGALTHVMTSGIGPDNGSGEHAFSNLVFVLGLDRTKVAASVAARHKEVLEFLDSGSSAGAGRDEPLAKRAARYGYEYCEKFIQVSHHVPRPGQRAIQEWIRNCLKSGSNGMLTGATDGDKPKAQSEDETELIAALLLMVMPALEHNPRRIKQFMNSFGAAWQVVSFGEEATTGHPPSPIHVAKLTALAMIAPDLYRTVRARPESLARLEEIAVDPESVPATDSMKRDLLGDPALRALLRYGLDRAQSSEMPDVLRRRPLFEFSFLGVDSNALLTVDSKLSTTTELDA